MGNENVLFCICGETASGKDSMVHALIEKYPDQLKCVVSHTNRPIREGEQDGIEHYFHTDEEFHNIMNDKKDDIVAYTKISKKNSKNGYEYFALKEDLEKANIYIIDPEGIKYLKRRKDLDMKLIVIYIYSSLYTRAKRAKANRSDYNSEFNRRVQAEKTQFNDFRENKAYDYIIENEYDFESAFNKLALIVHDELKKNK